MAAMLEIIDVGVGGLVAEIERLKLPRDTYLIFYSDNGGSGAVANNGGLRGAKGSFFEGGFRVPLIITRIPGESGQGLTPRVSDAVVWTPDLYPTFCQWAGAPLPERALDGVDLTPTLHGKAWPERTLFWHHAKLDGTGIKSALRDGDWKYLETRQGEPMLFNLADDPGEQTDLASAQPDRVTALNDKLNAWRHEVGASLEPAPEPTD